MKIQVFCMLKCYPHYNPNTKFDLIEFMIRSQIYLLLLYTHKQGEGPTEGSNQLDQRPPEAPCDARIMVTI